MEQSNSLKSFRQQYPQYDDMNDEALVVGLHKKFYSDMPLADFQRKIGFNHYAENPTEGMSGWDRFKAGYGAAVPNLLLGVQQAMQGGGGAGARATGIPQANERKLQAEIDERKKLDAPLMRTPGGVGGNMAGNLALLAPTVGIPGANTYTGATIIGGASGYAQPVASDESRELNTGVGVAAGIGGQALGNAVGRVFSPVRKSLSPEHTTLAHAAEREGIPLSAGQATGSRPLQTVESVFENLPLTSKPQLAAREEQQRAFTAAALRRAGINADNASPEVLAQNLGTLGGRLGDIAKRNQLDFNAGLTDRLAAIADDAAKHLPTDASSRVGGTIDKVLAQVNETGAMAGTNYQGWREPLRDLAKGEGGRYFGMVRRAMDDAFREQVSGAEGEVFRSTSRQYANLKTIIDAMGGGGTQTATGQLVPSQLSAALSRALGREGKALGRGDLNELSRIGQVFVRDQVPNSGTAQRLLLQNLLTGNVGAGVGYTQGETPGSAAAGAALMMGGSLAAPRLAQALLNSRLGQAYLKRGIRGGISPSANDVLSNALRTSALAAPAASR